MYEEFFGHFGLQRNPFHVSPNPRGFYSTAAHDEALLQLVFGIESRQGLMVLIGEPGTGKTTILQYLLEWLHQQNYSTSYIFHTMVPSLDLLRLILRDFGIPCSEGSKSQLLIGLREWLIQRKRAGDCPVIIIDEAQALGSRALNELRLLLNLEDSGTKLVQLVVAGQPHLEDKLRWRRLAHLRQRIMCHCKLPCLTPGETAGYIESRLAKAGAVESGLFPEETVQEIFRYSRGIPRVINLICENALLAAYADRRSRVSQSDIAHVAQQFDLGTDAEQTGEILQPDTFCRLIPFPKLDAANIPVRPSEPETALPPEVEAEPQVLPEEIARSNEPKEDLVAKEAPEPVVSASENLSSAMAPRTEAPKVVVASKPRVATLRRRKSAPRRIRVAVRVKLAKFAAMLSQGDAGLHGISAWAKSAMKPASEYLQEFPPRVAAVIAALFQEIGEMAVRGRAGIRKVFSSTKPVAARPAERPRKWPVKLPPKPLGAIRVAAPPVVASAKKSGGFPARQEPAPVKPVAMRQTKVQRLASDGRFTRYWQEVGRSFVRDGQHLLRQWVTWNRKPLVETRRSAAIARRRHQVMSSVSVWLRMPFGSAHIPSQPSRASSTAHRRL